MFRQIFFGVLLAVVAGASLANDDYLHEPTKIKLPAMLHEFVRGSTTNFESSQQGQGVGVSFQKPDSHNATLFIYTAGLPPASLLSIDHPLVAEERERTVHGILTRAKSQEPLGISANSRKTFSTTWSAPTTPEKTAVYWDSFIVYLGGRATNDMSFIWVAKGHFWKLRLTRVPGGPTSSNFLPFVTSLIQLSNDQ